MYDKATIDDPPTKGRLWKLSWPFPFRTTIVLLVITLWMALLGTWIAFSRAEGWQEFLSGIKLQMKGSSAAGIGRRADAPGKLAYFGDGEAELGEYSVSMFDPVTGATLRTSFQLEGKTVFQDEASFKEFMKNNNRFFREQVTVTVRNCEPNDLLDPDLPLLEKKLVSRVNRALGRRVLESIHIKDFYLFE